MPPKKKAKKRAKKSRKPARKRAPARVPPPDLAAERKAACKRCADLLGKLDRKENQLALVNGVLRTIISGATITELLRVFGSNLKQICPYDRASISLVDYERKVFHIPFMLLGGRVLETHELPRSFTDTVLMKVVESRAPLLRKNIKAEKDFATDKPFVQKGFSTEMIFPLMVGNLVFGTFQVGCHEAGRLTDAHLRLLTEIMPAIAIAVYQHFSDRKFIYV